jgi:hypothetical protein
MATNKEDVLTYELACEFFRYEKDTGFLFWKTAKKNRNLSKPIGSKNFESDKTTKSGDQKSGRSSEKIDHGNVRKAKLQF